MGSFFGRIFRVSTFGESHGPAIGVIVDGVPSGLVLDPARIQKDLDRRRPGTSRFVSPRKEADVVEVLSGLADGRTLGSPLAMLIRNTNVRSRDYSELAEVFRPGHADYSYFRKYGLPPQPGGGRASGRETAARVAAGAVARVLLEACGVTIKSGTIAIAGLRARDMDLDFAETNPLRFTDPALVAQAEALVDAARLEGDSVGGLVEMHASGVPAGWGHPVFEKLDAVLGMAALSIGAVKGVEFGDGFDLANLRGSQTNDQMTSRGFLSNHAGGILGGISTGQAIIMRVAIKPTPSISKPQQTVNIHGDPVTIQIHGRHDPCLCPRIGPVLEAMTAMVLADAMLEQKTVAGLSGVGGQTENN